MEARMGRKMDCIQPCYVSRFRCDGSLCDSLCCHNWEVRLDDRTYMAYRELEPEEWKQRILEAMSWDGEAGCHVFRPGKEDKACPMLRKDRLCSIQRQFGEDALSDVCAEYPRKTWLLPGILERALCMTCPVASELILSEPEPMRFEQVQVSSRREAYFLRADDAERIREISFFDLQWTGIAVLQDRSRSLRERLQLLEQFLSGVDDLLDSGRESEIPVLAEAYGEGRYPAGGRTGTKESRDGRRFYWAMLQHLTEKLEDDAAETAEYLALGKKVFGDREGSLSSGQEIRCREFIEAHEVKLEHYLVNEYFMELYPCAFAGSFVLNGRVLEALSGMIDLQLFLRAGSGKELEERDFLDSIRWMSVRTNHYVDYTVEMMKYLRGTEESRV